MNDLIRTVLGPGRSGRDPASSDAELLAAYTRDGDHEIDFYAELAKHLQNGWVAIVMEVGAEKLRYVTGYAVAVNHNGKCCDVSIDRIYQLARG